MKFPLNLPEGSIRAIIALAIVAAVISLAFAAMRWPEALANSAAGALLTAFGTVIEKYFRDAKSRAALAMKARQNQGENP